MGDITSPKLIVAKGFLFLLAGGMAAAALLLEYPTLKAALLLGLAVWCFARFYYFAFYVIEHYIDPTHRYAGLAAFLGYLLRRRAVPRARHFVAKNLTRADRTIYNSAHAWDRQHHHRDRVHHRRVDRQHGAARDAKRWRDRGGRRVPGAAGAFPNDPATVN